jgi:hypothetical protein
MPDLSTFVMMTIQLKQCKDSLKSVYAELSAEQIPTPVGFPRSISREERVHIESLLGVNAICRLSSSKWGEIRRELPCQQ